MKYTIQYTNIGQIICTLGRNIRRVIHILSLR